MPERLRQLHPAVIAHDEMFDPVTQDIVWLRAAAEQEWIVLMKDDRIRYRAAEQRLIISEGIRCFCLHPSKEMKGEDMAEALAIALAKILRIAQSARPGFIKGVNRNGSIRHMFP